MSNKPTHIIWDREGAGGTYEDRGALGSTFLLLPGVPVEIGNEKEGQVPPDFAERLVVKNVAAYCTSSGTKIKNVTAETREDAKGEKPKNVALPATEVVTTEG